MERNQVERDCVTLEGNTRKWTAMILENVCLLLLNQKAHIIAPAHAWKIELVCKCHHVTLDVAGHCPGSGPRISTSSLRTFEGACAPENTRPSIRFGVHSDTAPAWGFHGIGFFKNKPQPGFYALQTLNWAGPIQGCQSRYSDRLEHPLSSGRVTKDLEKRL